MSYIDPWIMYNAFIESWNFTLPSWKYANDVTPQNSDAFNRWKKDFEKWFKEGAKKFWVLISLPSSMVYDVTKNNTWMFDSTVNDYVLFYQPYEAAQREEYRLSKSDYEYAQSQLEDMTASGTLPSTTDSINDSQSQELTAGVASALLENMVNSATLTADEKKYRMDVSKDLDALTSGILTMYNQGIIDKFEEMVESAEEALTPVERVLTETLYNEEQASKLGWHGLVPYFTRFNNSQELTNGRILRYMFNQTAHPDVHVPANYVIKGILIMPYNNNNPSNPRLFVTTFICDPTADINTDFNFTEHISGSAPYQQHYFSIEAIGNYDCYICQHQSEDVDQSSNYFNDFYPLSNGYDASGAGYIGHINAGDQFSLFSGWLSSPYYLNDFSKTIVHMTMHDSQEKDEVGNPTISVPDRGAVDVEDAVAIPVPATDGEAEKKKKERSRKRVVVGDIDNDGTSDWSDDSTRPLDRVRDETGTGIIDRSDTIERIKDAVDRALDALDRLLDRVGEKTQDTTKDGSNPPPPSADPSIIIPSGDTSVKGLFTIWNPTPSQVAGLASYLWSSIFSGDFIDQFKKWFSNPMDAIISLAYYPIVPTSEQTGEIKLGAFSSGVTGVRVVKSMFQTLDCGTVSINRYFNNFLDFTPYTKISIYLPFIGVVPLNVDDIMGGKIRVEYRVEFMTGSCIASIYVSNVRETMLNEALLYQYSGNVAMQIPLSGANYSSVYAGVIGGLATGISAFASGGASLAMGALAVKQATSGKEQLQRTGSLGGNSGLLGVMKPYLIIERPIVSSPDTYGHLLGKQSNSSTLIGNLAGYTELENFDLTGVDCTDVERDELKQILQTGFFA